MRCQLWCPHTAMNWWFLSGFNYEKIERCQESCHWRRQRQEKEEKKSQQSSPRSSLVDQGWKKRCNKWTCPEWLIVPQVSKGVIQFLEDEFPSYLLNQVQRDKVCRLKKKRRVNREASSHLRDKTIHWRIATECIDKLVSLLGEEKRGHVKIDVEHGYKNFRYDYF